MIATLMIVACSGPTNKMDDYDDTPHPNAHLSLAGDLLYARGGRSEDDTFVYSLPSLEPVGTWLGHSVRPVADGDGDGEWEQVAVVDDQWHWVPRAPRDEEWVEAVSTWSVPSSWTWVTAPDLDADGDADIVVSRWDWVDGDVVGGDLRLVPADATGLLDPLAFPQLPTSLSVPCPVETRDVDLDGDLEWMCSSPFAVQHDVDGLSFAPDFVVEDAELLVAADLTGDGSTDYVLHDIQDNRVVSFWEGTTPAPAGATDLSNLLEVGGRRVAEILATDLDGDGHVDLVVALLEAPGEVPGRVVAFGGPFDPRPALSVDAPNAIDGVEGELFATSMVATDLDGDGLDEIIVTAPGSPSPLRVLRADELLP